MHGLPELFDDEFEYAEWMAMSILAAPRHEDPWKHFTLHDPLHPTLWRYIARKSQTWTAHEFLSGKPKRGFERLPRHAGGLQSKLARVLTSEQVQDALEARLGVRGVPDPRFVHDKPGHFSEAHPDVEEKLATVQIYLSGPRDAGTALYSRDGERPYTKIPLLPNSGYFFRRADDTYHGIGKVEPGGDRRSILMPVFRLGRAPS